MKKEVLDVKKWVQIQNLIFDWQLSFPMGGRVTKCFTVNLFLRCRQSLIGRYTLDIVFWYTRNIYVRKEVLDVKKWVQSQNLIFDWQLSFHMGG